MTPAGGINSEAIADGALADPAFAEDGAVLQTAAREGRVAARLFEHGDFSETGFLFYGRLERLCAQGLLRFESWSGDGIRGSGDVLAVFLPVRAKAA